MTTRTRNTYRNTLWMLFRNAGTRGRFSRVDSDNPFEGLHQRLTKAEKNSHYSRFEVTDIPVIFDSFRFQTSPKRRTPETALPWVALIAAFTGMRLEEIAQLAVGDIKDIGGNGSTVTVFDIHDLGDNHLKTDDSAVRRVPIHSALVRAGLAQLCRGVAERLAAVSRTYETGIKGQQARRAYWRAIREAPQTPRAQA